MQISWLPSYQKQIEKTISRLLEERYGSFSDSSESLFADAVKHAVSAGGKRLRPVFAMITYEYIKQEATPEILLESIVGIEMIHAYSLVHDDLPCMDNDDFRRGKPTVWKQYGETLAVLVGDGLQSYGIELLARSRNPDIILEVARNIGDFGMVRGQVRDMLLDQEKISIDELFRLHDEKTGAIIATSFSLGARLAGARDEEVSVFQRFGILLGRAFQLQDDILDFEGTLQQLGKKTGKDIELGKGIVSKIGIDRSKKLLSDMENELILLLKNQTITDQKFFDMIYFVIHRSI